MARKMVTHAKTPAEWSDGRADNKVLVNSDELMVCEDIQGLFGSLSELHSGYLNQHPTSETII